jgi:hypothetical protein
MMPTTPNFALRYPALSDSPNGPTQIANLALDTDTALTGLDGRLDAIDAGTANLYTAKYTRSTAQGGIVAGTNTKITWDGVSFNKGGVVTEAAGVLTCTKTGLYHVYGCVQMASNTGTTYCWLGHGTNTAAADRYALEDRSNRNGLDTFSFSAEKQFTAPFTLALWTWNSIGPAATAVSEMITHLGLRWVGDAT